MNQLFSEGCKFRLKFEEQYSKKLDRTISRQQSRWKTVVDLVQGLTNIYGDITKGTQAKPPNIGHLKILFKFCVDNGLDATVLDWFKAMATQYAQNAEWEIPSFQKTPQVSDDCNQKASVSSSSCLDPSLQFLPSVRDVSPRSSTKSATASTSAEAPEKLPKSSEGF